MQHERQALISAAQAICVVVATDHDAIDYAAVAAAVPSVFDAKGTYRRRGIAADNVVAL